jgi:hypothetical protein
LFYFPLSFSGKDGKKGYKRLALCHFLFGRIDHLRLFALQFSLYGVPSMAFNTLQLLRICSLFFVDVRFQQVQHASATTTSLFFIPCVISGAVTNIASGLLVSRVKANHLALAGALASTIAPVLLANMNIEWSYWRAAFWAMTLIPLSADGTSISPVISF